MTGRGRGFAGALLVFGLAGDAAFAGSAGLRPVELDVRPIGRFLPTQDDTRFGALDYRGGLELISSDPDFGSLSGVDFLGDGSLLAVSDKGRWFAARPLLEDGQLVGLADAAMAPILNEAGDPLSGKRWGDAEGVRIVEEDGRAKAYVVFERTNDVRAFSGPDFALSKSVGVTMPQSFHAITGRDGAEAIAAAPASSPLAGSLVVIAELLHNGDGDIRGWIAGGESPGAFAIRRLDDYDVTDADFLPDGDLLILERKYGFPYGIAARVRRIPGGDLAPGRTVDGAVIFEATLGHQIDNMEGLATTTGPNGETLVALVSDNNQSPLQRTLLLYFALVEERDATARSAD